MFRLLDDSVTQQQLGVVLYAPIDVVVQRAPVPTLKPDLFFLSKEKGGTPENICQMARLEVAPDIAIEIFSSSEIAMQLADRLDDYHRLGVLEVWLVYLGERVVQVSVGAYDGWRLHSLFGGKEKGKSIVLLDLDLPIAKIFAY